jgi:hypothetical protein
MTCSCGSAKPISEGSTGPVTVIITPEKARLSGVGFTLIISSACCQEGDE